MADIENINLNEEADELEDEKDIVEFEDDKGNRISMEVLDYLFYEGKEYALLAEMKDDPEEQREAYIMEVVPLDDEMEEFVPVDEELAEKLIEIFENPDEADEEFEDEE